MYVCICNLALLNGERLVGEAFDVLFKQFHIADHLLVTILVALAFGKCDRLCQHVACRQLLGVSLLSLHLVLLTTQLHLLRLHRQEGLAVASIARDDPSTLPGGDDPFPRARMNRDRNAR